MTVMETVIWLADPVTCTKPDGTQVQTDNPLSGIPFLSNISPIPGANCVNGPSLAGQAVDSAFGPGAWQDAVASTVKDSGTFWLSQPSPEVADSNHVITGAAANLNANLMWVTLAVLMVCIAIKAGQIAWAGSKAHEPIRELVHGLFDYFIAAGCAAGLIAAVLAFTDQFSQWLVDKAAHGSFADNLSAFLSNTDLLSGMNTILAIALMGLALIVSILQEFLFAARGGVLVVLVGIYLLSASTTSLRRGRAGHEKLTSWIIGFTLYKVAAACIYAGAFWLIGTPAGTANGTWTVLQGIALICLSVFAIYAVIKIAFPATEPVAGNGWSHAATATMFIAK